ncbi:M16 family metallopeptidase [Asticcacaulis solisilvae]|uniref:M16 family metallopeptidase n=1 Tax=Asticcacaulis solisilvae TaxID=1217274 RepID=UPI003FD8CE53
MHIRNLFLSACVLTTALTALPAASHPMPAVTFAQEHSALKADAAQLYGRLPNGMTYVIQKNTTPPGTAYVLLRIRAGSMMETDAQKGLAHFVEHMAFEGTTHIGHGELKPMLERNGFAFGADANAYTTASTTTYVLNAPRSDDKTLGQALFILREVAGNMIIAPADVDSERGVILSEERVRENAYKHRDTAFGKFLYPGLRMADYSDPIGSTDVIKAAPADELKRFYKTWYRPELATLVIVGDFDPAAMEKQIKAKFSDWKAATPTPEEPDWGAYAAKGPRVFDYAAKGLNREVAATWIRPLETRPDGLDREIETAQDALLATLLNRRFQALQVSGEAQFASASLSFYENYKTSRNIVLSVIPKPGKAKDAFAQTWGVFHTFAEHGVTRDEAALVQSLVPELRSNVEKSYSTRDNSAIAGSILNDIDTDSVLLGLADSLKTIDQIPAALTQDRLNARLKTLFSADGPVFADYGDDIADFPPQAVMAEFTRISGTTTEAYAETVRKDWPYTNFGTPVQPATHSVDKDFGFGHYVFPNGVVLNIKPNRYAANTILVQVDFAGGARRFDPKTPRPMPLLFSDFFIAGGLGKLDITEIQRSLAGKTVNINYLMTSRHTSIGGATTPGDLDTELQVLMAYATDPALRGQNYAQFQAYTPERLRTQRSTPGGVMNYELSSVLHPGDWRYDIHTQGKAPSIAWEDVASLFRDSLKDTPITVTVVGDVDEAKAVAATAATFATLPQRPAEAPFAPGSNSSTFPPAQREFVFTHDGRADQNISAVLWPTTDFYADVGAARGLYILAGVVQNRMFDELREKEGADYSPGAFSSMDNDFTGFGFFEITATIKAENDGAFRAAVTRILADIKAHPPTRDEIERVRAPMLQGNAKARLTDDYWFALMVDQASDPRARTTYLNLDDSLKAVDGKRLSELAAKWLKDDTAIHVTVKPSAAK